MVPALACMMSPTPAQTFHHMSGPNFEQVCCSSQPAQAFSMLSWTPPQKAPMLARARCYIPKLHCTAPVSCFAALSRRPALKTLLRASSSLEWPMRGNSGAALVPGSQRAAQPKQHIHCRALTRGQPDCAAEQTVFRPSTVQDPQPGQRCQNSQPWQQHKCPKMGSPV